MNAQGYTLHVDSERVVIATGFKRATNNRKTGDMIQVWILTKRQDPVSAVRSGADSLICGSCPLRGNATTGRTCYVTLAQAPLAVWKAYHAGRYPALPTFTLFAGRKVRFGAYGDPSFIPMPLVQSIASNCAGWTGYTHQWEKPWAQAFRRFVMASVESIDGARKAQAMGWRTFRVKSPGAPLEANEITCLSDAKGISCADCRLCAGTSKPARSIAIDVHGNGSVHFASN